MPFGIVASNQLAAIGKPAVPALMIALDDEYKDVRAHAGWTLALIGESARKAVPRLIDAG